MDPPGYGETFQSYGSADRWDDILRKFEKLTFVLLISSKMTGNLKGLLRRWEETDLVTIRGPKRLDSLAR
jgi:hypothetical protein